MVKVAINGFGRSAIMKTAKEIFSSKLSAQEMQDEIFRTMSADEKMKLAAGLWKLGRAINPDKANYGRERPSTSSDQSSPAS